MCVCFCKESETCFPFHPSADPPGSTPAGSTSFRCLALALASSSDHFTIRSSASQPGNPSHQHVQGRLLGLLHLRCHPGCRPSSPHCRYSLQSMQPGSPQHWGLSFGFYHACLGFPVKQTWLDAIKAGNCDTFDGLTYSNAAKYCPDADEMIMGHLSQQRQNVRSTKPKQPMPAPLVVLPLSAATPSNQVYITTQLLSKLFMQYSANHL